MPKLKRFINLKIQKLYYEKRNQGNYVSKNWCQ